MGECYILNLITPCPQSEERQFRDYDAGPNRRSTDGKINLYRWIAAVNRWRALPRALIRSSHNRFTELTTHRVELVQNRLDTPVHTVTLQPGEPIWMLYPIAWRWEVYGVYEKEKES